MENIDLVYIPPSSGVGSLTDIQLNSLAISPQTVTKAMVAWAKAYPDASFEVIHSENYLDWIGA